MDSIISSLIYIALYPFTSGTLFVTIPFAFVVVGCLFAIIRRLMGGKY